MEKKILIDVKNDLNDYLERIYFKSDEFKSMLNKHVEENLSNHTIYKKPPLGITPKWVLSEARKIEILDAMSRYSDADVPIPSEWINELRELVLEEQQEGK